MSQQKGSPYFAGEILLCEDSKTNQDIISERLSKFGFTITVAENGKEGIEKVKYRIEKGIKPFDLVFMDINMPVMNGLEAAAEICKLNTGTPVIAMTANSSPADREQYKACGMNDCVCKPFTRQELQDCLLKYIRPVNQDTDKNPHEQDGEELKVKLMRVFMRDNANKYNEIIRALDTGDVTLAHRLTHTLKGTAGLLGKAGLQKAAEDLESLLLSGKKSENHFVMHALKTEMDAVLKECMPLAGEACIAEIKTEIFDKEKLRALFDELEPLLDGGNPECLRLADSLRRIPGTGDLIRHMEYFEFDKAMEEFARLKK